MSNSQPAGSRLMQDLLSRVSPGSQSMLSSAHMNSQAMPTDQSTVSQIPEIDDATKLALFGQVLDEVAPVDASVLSQAVPVVVAQQEIQQAEEQAQQVGGKQKEALDGGGFSLNTTELPGGMSYVEEEPAAPEIPPEVESYVSHVEKQAEINPDTFVVAQDAPADANQPVQPPRIVKVLPITKEQEAVGMKKNPSFSIRWLVEFGRKIAKVFAGEVVYRQ